MSKYDSVMMKTAQLFANQSYCVRRKVGAVLARDGRILCTGYNGTISGMPNVCEILDWENTERINITKTFQNDYQLNFFVGQFKNPVYKVDVAKFTVGRNTEVLVKGIKAGTVTSDFTLHAEENVIAYAAKNGIAISGATLYTTTSPCKRCSKLIAQSGISRVVYGEDYHDCEGVDFLKQVGVEVSQFILNNNQQSVSEPHC